MAVAERSGRGRWRRALRRSTEGLAILLIGYALLVVAGRQLLPLLNRYQPEINGYFSRQLGVSVRTTTLSGEWSGLTPRLRIGGITIATDGADSGPGAAAMQIARAEAELDLIATLRAGAPVWRELLLSGIALNAVESADGHWSAGGRQLGATPGSALDKVVGTLFLSRRVQIDEVAVHLDFFTGSDAIVRARELRTENSAGFHRTTATLAVADSGEAAHIVFEGEGDPLDLARFHGQAYVRLDRINFAGPVRALAERWFPDAAARIAEARSDVATELWFALGAGRGIEMRGRLQAAMVPLPAAAGAGAIRELRADLTGWFHPGASWGLRAQNLHFAWADAEIAPLNIEISQALGRGRDSLAIAVDHLELATLARLFAASGLASARVQDHLRTLNPRGKLAAVHLRLPLGGQQVGAIRANIEHLDIEPGVDSPGARNLSGYLEFVGDRGFFELDCPDGFAMYYPQAYDDYMVHGPTRGRVNIRWAAAENALRLAGGPIAVDGEEGQARAYLYLHLPLDHRGEPEMFLLAGLRNSHSRYAPRYLPNKLNPVLRGWLDRAIGAVDVPAAGFIWRGSLRARNAAGRSLLIYGQLANGTVDYDPGWPKVTGLAADFTVEGDQFQARIQRGTLAGGHLQRGEVATRHGRNGHLLLDVDAVVDAPLQTAMDILAASPLRPRVAALHQNWRFGGQTQATLDLAIPLAADKTDEHYRVVADLVDGRLALPAAGLAIEHIQGPLRVDGAVLNADRLVGSLWGEPLTGSLRTEAGGFRVDATGTLPIQALLAQVPPLHATVSGKTPWQGTLVLPGGTMPPRLEVTSTLEGVALSLPAPFEKAADAAVAVAATAEFAPDAVLASIRYGAGGNGLNAVARWRNYRFDRAGIELGEAPAALPEAPGLKLSGHWPLLPLSAWLTRLGGDPGGNALAALKPKLDVHFDALEVAGLRITDIALGGHYGDDGWRLHANSANFAGDIALPARGPLALRLDTLVLPAPAAEHAGLLNAIDPRRLPAVDFSTRRLRLGERELGALAFSARPEPAGVRLDRVEADLTGLRIGADGDGTAALEWRRDAAGDSTVFAGTVAADDLGQVLKTWGLPALLTSREAAFVVDVGWPDTPWNFALARIEGQIALHLRDGAFHRDSGITTNALTKLVGLVNFDTWLRRLRLDFSDLFGSGVNYDSLRGGLRFSRGKLAFDEPIVATLPSGRLRLYGDADLQAETIDARLVATLPVATNLPWVVALAGGLPAAAGVYLSGKLFKRQVDKLSSLSYRITGPWADPKLDIDKIFTDGISAKRPPDGKSGRDTAQE